MVERGGVAQIAGDRDGGVGRDDEVVDHAVAGAARLHADRRDDAPTALEGVVCDQVIAAAERGITDAVVVEQQRARARRRDDVVDHATVDRAAEMDRRVAAARQHVALDREARAHAVLHVVAGHHRGGLAVDEDARAAGVRDDVVADRRVVLMVVEADAGALRAARAAAFERTLEAQRAAEQRTAFRARARAGRADIVHAHVGDRCVGQARQHHRARLFAGKRGDVDVEPVDAHVARTHEQSRAPLVAGDRRVDERATTFADDLDVVAHDACSGVAHRDRTHMDARAARGATERGVDVRDRCVRGAAVRVVAGHRVDPQLAVDVAAVRAVAARNGGAAGSFHRDRQRQLRGRGRARDRRDCERAQPPKHALRTLVASTAWGCAARKRSASARPRRC
ncbi:MAG TPA: hypothetical protein VG755_37090 [Nannocystaceae bacterium]|nr:hypothetical protein [Nannocystaceae bacterium]